MYEKMFSPGKIGNVTVKNCLVMSPMGTGLANLDGTPTEDMIAFYEARACGGVGLISTEVCRVNDVHGAAMLRQLSLTRDRNIEPMSRMVQSVQKHGAKMFCQLHHPGRETVPALLGGQPVVAPSAIPCKFLNSPTRALENAEVKELVQQFGEAAMRAKKAGFDGVILHAAHGYLLEQFLSPYTNKREDEYGGSFENRLRFISEIIDLIHEKCGADYPLVVRLGVEEFLDKTGVAEDYIHIQDGVRIAMAIEKLGVSAIDVSCGIYETGVTVIEPVSFQQGWRRDLIKAVKDHVSVPVIAVSAIKEPDVGEKMLAGGVMDFLSLGRAWLADPDWGRKALEGRESELRKCIGCLRCFESLNDNIPIAMPPECAVNPILMREGKFSELPADTAHHTVVVVGGGVAGMSAARTLAVRGSKVTLLEKSDQLGGLVNYASASPLKGNMRFAIDFYENEFRRLGVDLRLGTEATVEMLEKMAPDGVVVATGALPIDTSKIPGADLPNVFGMTDVLGGAAGIENKNVVIIGAGVTGLECGEYLNAHGNRTTIVDMLDQIAPNDNHTIVADDCGRLRMHGTSFMLKHALKTITPEGVILECLDSGAEVMVAADVVVLSLGLVSNNTLTAAIKEKFPEVCDVGGAVDAGGKIPQAVRTGFECAAKMFTKEKESSFRLSDARMKDFGKVSLMDDQEGLYLCYLTDPEAIKKVLPAPLKPFSMPVVTLSICHVNNPSFADDYYEAILGVYAMYGKNLGLYPLGLVLGGPGAEMATQCGRDNGSIPKKMGAEFVIRRSGETVTASVTRRGVQLVDAKLELGSYNSPLAAAMYQFPAPGKKVYGGGFYFHFDRVPDVEGVSHFVNGAFLSNLCEYNYKSWEPGFASLKLQSGADDPWSELPINTIVGGAMSMNSLLVHKLNYIQDVDADAVVPYLMTGRYDRTAFMETGRV
ncbi:MAG: FAD-dependent oxidoreductase [Clostridia bacterium]|nr:FAD-dependent oxidoreductase [Clostridia bacterium]